MAPPYLQIIIWTGLILNYMHLRLLPLISPFEKGLLILINLNSLYTRMLRAKLRWNWPSRIWEEFENLKSLHKERQTEGQIDTGPTLKDHLSLQLIVEIILFRLKTYVNIKEANYILFMELFAFTCTFTLHTTTLQNDRLTLCIYVVTS